MPYRYMTKTLSIIQGFFKFIVFLFDVDYNSFDMHNVKWRTTENSTAKLFLKTNDTPWNIDVTEWKSLQNSSSPYRIEHIRDFHLSLNIINASNKKRD